MRRAVAVMLLALAVATPAWSWAAERPNLQIFNDASKQVNRYPYFTIFDSVHLDVDDGGVVTLTGKVTLPYKASEIAKRVAKVNGVTRVINRMEALPVSQSDSELRVQIARAIYAHPSLAQYGLGPNPSIHVIVEHGRVTLDGVVNNDHDRTVARMVARQFMSFGVTDALKTDEEVKADLERL